MICVSIGRGRHKQMIAEHLHLVQQGAKLVELRLDYIRREISLKRLLSNRPCPVIATCRREQDGGKWTGSEHERLMLLRSAVAEGVEYVDLEDDIAGDVPRYGVTKRIVSLHNFQDTPDDLSSVHARLEALDADIVKIATMAHNPYDNLRMLRLIEQNKTPTIGICMGDIGIPTRILAGKFGAPFTYATFHHERSLAPGQLSFRQMTEIYHYEDIDAETEVFGVIADPVGHSLGPTIHNAAFRHMKMNKVYIPFRVAKGDLSEFIKDCPELGLRGLSVTIPHKESVVNRLTKVDSAVNGIGSANTVVFRNDHRLGYNTDCNAAMDSLGAVYGDLKSKQPLARKVALVLGAGGVARAIAFGLKRWGAEVIIASRTFERAEKLAEQFECRAIDWKDCYGVKPNILINCTPVGMHPNVDETPYKRQHLKPSTVVFDTIYNPEQTLLIKEARKQGCRVVTGVDMFVRQAAMQFKLFTGQDAPTEVMHQTLKRATGPYGRG